MCPNPTGVAAAVARHGELRARAERARLVAEALAGGPAAPRRSALRRPLGLALVRLGGRLGGLEVEVAALASPAPARA